MNQPVAVVGYVAGEVFVIVVGLGVLAVMVFGLVYGVLTMGALLRRRVRSRR